MVRPKRSKYGAIRTSYKGEMYDSKREAAHAASLDLRVRAGEVVKWERQVTFALTVNGVKVCTYRADFVVEGRDGTKWIEEVKGRETRDWKLKERLFRALHPTMELKVIR